MSGKATGASPEANGNAHNRTHNDGSSGRAFTTEQKAAVVRVRKCDSTAFYDILGLEAVRREIDDAGIKKAYRKLSLLTHPDKNGYPGSDEAFKMVSRAFQILSDADKRSRYDQYGGDPDNRFASSGPSASPFSGFGRSQGAGTRGPMFDEEISPEELFRQFFGGGGGGGFGGPFGGGLFDSGPGFVFNLGGGPGVRVHQFGGNRPRRRPAGARQADGPPPTAYEALRNLLPLLLLFLIPIISQLLSSSTSGPALPQFNIDIPKPPMTFEHRTRLSTRYFVNPVDVAQFSDREWRRMDDTVDRTLINWLDQRCGFERKEKEDMLYAAQGWFTINRDLYQKAQNMPMDSCQRLTTLSRAAGYY